MGYEGEVSAYHAGDYSVALDKGSGVVYGIVVSATNTRTVLNVYDGTSASGDLLLRVAAEQRTTIPVVCPRPLSYNKGLYIEVDSGLGGFTIFFDHLEK